MRPQKCLFAWGPRGHAFLRHHSLMAPPPCPNTWHSSQPIIYSFLCPCPISPVALFVPSCIKYSFRKSLGFFLVWIPKLSYLSSLAFLFPFDQTPGSVTNFSRCLLLLYLYLISSIQILSMETLSVKILFMGSHDFYSSYLLWTPWV